MGLFATHPPVEKRVAALMAYAAGHDVEPTAAPAAPGPQAAEPAPAADKTGPWGQRRDAPPGPWG